MVDRKEIEKKINIIFDFERRNIIYDKKFHYVEVIDEISSDKSFKVDHRNRKTGIQGGYVNPPRAPRKDYQLNPEDNFILDWDTFRTLKQLYNSVERIPGCRDTFIGKIENKLSELGFTASLAFYFLLKIGCNDIIIQTLNSKILGSMTWREFRESHDSPCIPHEVCDCARDVDTLYADIVIFMYLEPTYFNEYFLGQLKDIIHYKYYGWSITSKEKFDYEALSLSYSRLENELKGSNEELNIHKENVIGMITKYGFPSDMETCLLEIDKLPDHLSDWLTINSGMIGNLRSFFEVLVKGIAAKIKTKTGKDYPTDKPSEMGNKRAYIKEQLGLSEKDNKLIDSFVDILVKEGGHALTSDKKHFMLTKNIGIELAYFLLSVYEEKFENRLVNDKSEQRSV